MEGRQGEVAVGMSVDYGQLNLKNEYWCCGSVTVTGEDGKCQVCASLVVVVWCCGNLRGVCASAICVCAGGRLLPPLPRLFCPCGLAARRQHLGWCLGQPDHGTADLLARVRGRGRLKSFQGQKTTSQARISSVFNYVKSRVEVV